MNRQEPYIGMPIILASLDEDRMRQNKESNEAASQQKTQAAASCDVACTQSENRQPMMPAMAYVPWQRWQDTYPLDEGLRHGTIFPELDLPFEGKRRGGMRR